MSANISIRMCIICKSRLPKQDLIRFWFIDGAIVFSNSSGRSCYICTKCKAQKSSEKKLKKKYANIDFKEMF